MGSFFDGLLYEKKPPVAIRKIRKPKQLTGVSVYKGDDCLKVKLWDIKKIVVPNKEKFYGTYKSNGSWDRLKVNNLTNGMATFTRCVNNLDTSLSISLPKHILVNRINKDGSNGSLFVRYDEGVSDGIYFDKRGDSVVISHVLTLSEELVFNNIPISVKAGPTYLAKAYGIPDIKLKLVRSNGYKGNKSANISKILFTWGDDTTKFEVSLELDVSYMLVYFKIIVH